MKKTYLLVLLFCVNCIAFGQDAEIWKRYTGQINNSNIPVLPNYSFAGYKLGNEAIPENPSLQTFNVTDYGAIPNDNNSDQVAIQATIDAAEANGGGIVLFPIGEFLINTNSDDNSGITVTASNIILKGSGSEPGKTIISMANNITPPNASPWGAIEMIRFYAPYNTSQATNIIQNENRGSYTIKVQNASIFQNKKFIELRMNATTNAIDDFLESKTPRSIWSVINNQGISAREIHEIASINTLNNTITLKDPVVDNINASYNWQVKSIDFLEGCGFEDIHFNGNFTTPFQHHANAIDDYGWKAIGMRRVAHSWVRRCKFSNISAATKISNSYACSVTSILIDGNRGHDTTIANEASTRILQGLIWDNTNNGQWHGPDMSALTSGSVVWRVTALKGRGFDLHAAQARTNLIDMYESYDLSGAGGNYTNNPNHLSGLTIWNLKRVGPSVSNHDFWSDCGSNYCGLTVVNPIIVGTHGSNTSFVQSNVKYEESNGTKVGPESLYEAQLTQRLGTTPLWVSTMISEYNQLKIDWYAPDSGSALEVAFSLPDLSIQGSQTLAVGSSLKIEAIVSSPVENIKLYMNDVLVREEVFAPYEWGHTNDLDLELKNLTSGVYNLQLVATNANSLEAEASIVITISDVLSSDEFVLDETSTTLQLYPNPVKNVLSVQGVNENDEIAIFDLSGRLYTIKAGMITDQKTELDVSQLKSGIYFLINKNRNKTLRFIKE